MAKDLKMGYLRPIDSYHSDQPDDILMPISRRDDRWQGFPRWIVIRLSQQVRTNFVRAMVQQKEQCEWAEERRGENILNAIVLFYFHFCKQKWIFFHIALFTQRIYRVDWILQFLMSSEVVVCDRAWSVEEVVGAFLCPRRHQVVPLVQSVGTFGSSTNHSGLSCIDFHIYHFINSYTFQKASRPIINVLTKK